MSMPRPVGPNGAIMATIHFPHRLQPPPQHIRRARPDWTAAALAAFVAGAIFLLLMEMLAFVVYDESPWKLLRMMAAIVAGQGALEPDHLFDLRIVTLGLATHFTLAVAYAFVFAGLLLEIRRRAAAWIGIAFGVALYYVNLHGFTQIFPWFAELRTLDTLFAHVLFGLFIARFYREFAVARRA